MQKEPEFKPWVEDLIFVISVAALLGVGWLLNDIWFGRVLP